MTKKRQKAAGCADRANDGIIDAFGIRKMIDKPSLHTFAISCAAQVSPPPESVLILAKFEPLPLHVVCPS
jgi:hypothetical protein